MSDQLQLGDQPVAVTRTDGGRVTSVTDCGAAGALRVELVLVEEAGRRDVELVRILEGNRLTAVPIEQLEPLLRALSRARDSSERRRARRAER